MNIQTCEYVEASEVFKGFSKAWDVFLESNPDCSWGNNNRTLVAPSTIIEALENADKQDDEVEVDNVISRLEELGETYVDLEN